MENLNKVGMIELSESELHLIDGGLLIGNFGGFFHWAYTEFKKGLDDGYNGR